MIVIGGVPRSLINFRGPLLRCLAERGHEVIACAPDASEDVRGALERLGVRYQHVPIARAGLNPLQDWRTILRLRQLFQATQPNRIFAYTVKPVVYSCVASKGIGGPRVHTMITGLGYAFGDDSWGQKVIGVAIRVLYKRALQYAAGVFFQNHSDRELFAQLGLVPSSVPVTLVNGSGVDLRWFIPRPLPDSPVFLLIARLIVEKGIREYYEAAKELKKKYPTARFQLAGALDPNPSSISNQELQRWQSEAVIEYLGALEDVRPAYATARVYVLPSYREGTPRTVLEAMAMGRPVVTTDAPGCRETVTHGENGLLVPPRDSAELMRAMERFITQPELAKEMGETGLRRVAEKYDVHDVNQVILDAMAL